MKSLCSRAVRLVVGRGLIPPADVHRYGIRGRDLSMSNGVVLVESGSGRSFAVKYLSLSDGSEQGSPLTELRLYRAAADNPALQPFLPDFYDQADHQELMILEGLNTSRRLDQLTGGWSVFSVEIAGWFGRALGSWHRGAQRIEALGDADPWLFRIDGEDRLPALDADADLRELTEQVLSDPSLVSLLERAQGAWRRETTIHGDIRFANVMIQTSPPVVRFIDWEMAGKGDPAWDVAGAIQEYVSLASEGDSRIVGIVQAFLREYRSAADLPMSWDHLRPVVGCRLLLRALQLVNWEGDTADSTARHLELARTMAEGAGDPFRVAA